MYSMRLLSKSLFKFTSHKLFQNIRLRPRLRNTDFYDDYCNAIIKHSTE